MALKVQNLKYDARPHAGTAGHQLTIPMFANLCVCIGIVHAVIVVILVIFTRSAHNVVRERMFL